MDKMDKTNNTLLIVGTIIICCMMACMFWQHGVIEEQRQKLENTDTIISTDTLYLEKVVKDTLPAVMTKHVYITDTLWKVKGDSVIGEPQVITLVKKKSAIQ